MPKFEASAFSVRRVGPEEWIRAKSREPVRSVEELSASGVFPSDDEVDGFVTAVREWREADPS